ncbi:MAG: hypothetical protein WCJ30_11180 [Deltaproteobacteria bacterium]
MIPTERAPTVGDSLLRILRKVAPWLFYTGVHTYRVHSVSSEVGGAQSTGALALEPSGTRLFKAEPIVLQWGGAGVVVIPKVGSDVGIVFLDNDPTRPAIVAWQALALAGGRPDVVEVDADTAVRLGRHAAVTTVGAPGSAHFVADSSQVNGNFSTLLASLNTLATALAAHAPPIAYTPPDDFSNTAAAKLKSE